MVMGFLVSFSGKLCCVKCDLLFIHPFWKGIRTVIVVGVMARDGRDLLITSLIMTDTFTGEPKCKSNGLGRLHNVTQYNTIYWYGIGI